MRRLILIYNPRSSHFLQVKKDVIDKLRGLKGWMIGKYEVADTDVDDNASRLAKLLQDDDLVIAAGGDGTANIAVNGIMQADCRGIKLGVFGYGNFNDTARTFGKPTIEDILNNKAVEIWPLECKINGRHWRYAICYFTIGMFAEACEVFDHPKTRKSLRKGKKSILYSVRVLASWWFKERKRRHFMPEFNLGNSSDEYVSSRGASDYLALNGKTAARMMKGGKYFLQKDEFLSTTGTLTKFWRLILFMMRSILKQVPGTESDYDKLVFKKPSKMMFQAEGEYKMISDVLVVEIKKSTKPLLVIMK